MSYKNKNLCRVRTITVFLSLEQNQEQWKTEITKASNFLSKISKQLNYELKQVFSCGSSYSYFSTAIAIPCPPPIHSVARPFCLFV